MSEIPTLEDLEAEVGDLSGKRVLVRTDFNVPLDDDGNITDDFRIRSALPTIEWLTGRGAAVVTASHLGRPKGEPNPKYSMDPVRARLAELAPGVELLENLRFDPGETGNDPAFVARLVDGVDAYVNDAFGASHRAHASIVGPPRHVPSAMGRLLQREVDVLVGLRTNPKRPFVAVLGGAKISDKLGVVEALLETVDSLVMEAMKGKLDGNALRVPIPTGSLTDFTVNLKKSASEDEINAAFAAAAKKDLKGVLKYTEDPIVSSDIVTDPHSCIFDAGLTASMGKLVKVNGWYDNE